MIHEDSTLFSTVDWIIHELAWGDRGALLRLAAAALHEADATIGDRLKEDALRAFAVKAMAAHEEALKR